MKLGASEVFLNIPNKRKLDDILFIFYDDSWKLELHFNKKDFEIIINIIDFYSDNVDIKYISINNITIENCTLDEIAIKKNLNESNILNIVTRNINSYAFMKHLIIYKIDPNLNDDYYFRKILDEMKV